jgi:hypothetical protein
MTDEQNIVHPFLGGLIEEAKAMRFISKDKATGQPVEDPDRPGQPLMVDLPDRVVVVYGRKKANLCGAQVKAIAQLYQGKDEFSKGFREWCERCK